jgi:hypothetical protein
LKKEIKNIATKKRIKRQKFHTKRIKTPEFVLKMRKRSAKRNRKQKTDHRIEHKSTQPKEDLFENKDT